MIFCMPAGYIVVFVKVATVMHQYWRITRLHIVRVQAIDREVIRRLTCVKQPYRCDRDVSSQIVES